MDVKPRGGRPVRGSALRANQVWSGENAATNGFSSGGEDDGEGAKLGPSSRHPRQKAAPYVPHKAPVAGGVELGKLEAAALHRYRKFFRLGDASPTCSKDDLIPGVLRHFSNLVVEEETVLSHFVLAIQRQAKARSQAHGVQKPVSRK